MAGLDRLRRAVASRPPGPQRGRATRRGGCRDQLSSGAPGQPALRRRAERALDVLSLVLADVRYGLGPYGAIYLMAGHGWDEAQLALAAAFGGVFGLLSQGPIGAAVDALRAKRALLAGAALTVAATCLLVVLAPRFWPVAAAGVAGALAGNARCSAASSA